MADTIRGSTCSLKSVVISAFTYDRLASNHQHHHFVLPNSKEQEACYQNRQKPIKAGRLLQPNEQITERKRLTD